MNNFRLKVQADVNSKLCWHVSTWVINYFRLKVQGDVNSKIMLIICVHGW